MPARTFRLGCVVLDRTKLSEQDLILTLLSREGEQVRAVAKGARKPGGRLASRSELFSEVDVLLAKGRGALSIVSEAALVNPHRAIRGDYGRVCAASAVAELARLTSFEDVRDPYLYGICAKALSAVEGLSSQASLRLLTAAYALKVCAHCGWMPQLASCVACGDPDVSSFSSLAGGALCASCAKDVPGVRLLGAGGLSWVSSLLSLTFDQLLSLDSDDATASLLLEVSHEWASTHLDARLRCLEFMLGA
ncbi:DNA repair protein RecO [Olsenella massiliensis]|uniref:DNA repair protein RecO n=1 Tax=Olsenella massiliensis TaxID=1622075 RepID=UPI00071C7D1D|nr:DNA repair protein RecO [Olsenella massiliensis]